MTQPKIEGVGHGVPRMLYASDGSNWYAILVDSNGHVKIDVVTAALPTDAATQTTLAALLTELAYKLETGDLSIEAATKYLNVVVKTSALPSDAATETTLGAIKTALQIIDDFSLATNKLFGYYDIYEARVDTTTTSAGDNLWAPDTVPAGEVWIITAIGGFNLTTATGVMSCGKYDGTNQYRVKDTRYFTPTRIIDWSGVLVLHAGDYPYISFGSCALNDRRLGHIVGYKMKVA